VSSPSAFYALLLIHLHFPEAHSLKAKRAELRPVKAQLRERLGLSVAEVGHHDLWQRATLAAAVACGSPAEAEEAADRVQRFLDARLPQGVTVERAVTSFDEVLP
jgi:uncharacterized protein